MDFHIFTLIARFYKYDFWNPRKILDGHRCSKKNLGKFFEMKKFPQKMFFGKFLKIFENLKIL